MLQRQINDIKDRLDTVSDAFSSVVIKTDSLLSTRAELNVMLILAIEGLIKAEVLSVGFGVNLRDFAASIAAIRITDDGYSVVLNIPELLTAISRNINKNVHK